jgi:hypothetical protein
MSRQGKYAVFIVAVALAVASCGGGGSSSTSSSGGGTTTTGGGTGQTVTTAVALAPTAGTKPITTSPDQSTRAVGTITTIEDTVVKIVYFGNGADYISTVKFGSTLCQLTDSSNYPEITRTYTCQGKSNVVQNEVIDYIIATFEGTSNTFRTNIYTQSQAHWQSYVGLPYIDSLNSYIYYYNDGAPIISLNVKSLSGDEIDLPAGGAFNYIKINGSAGTFTCNKVTGESYKFQCPVVPIGGYTLDAWYNGGISEASFLIILYVSGADTAGDPTIPTLPDLF